MKPTPRRLLLIGWGLAAACRPQPASPPPAASAAAQQARGPMAIAARLQSDRAAVEVRFGEAAHAARVRVWGVGGLSLVGGGLVAERASVAAGETIVLEASWTSAPPGARLAAAVQARSAGGMPIHRVAVFPLEEPSSLRSAGTGAGRRKAPVHAMPGTATFHP